MTSRKKVFSAVNPYHPAKPTDSEITMAEYVTQYICNEFGLEQDEFKCKMAEDAELLPFQAKLTTLTVECISTFT